MKGKIIQWNDEKGFGFIVSDDGAEKVFFHISSLKACTRRPQVGDSVVYESSLDAKNHLQTKSVVFEGLVAQAGTQRKTQFIQVIPPQKNAFDYFLILVLLGCLGKAGWNFYHTHILNESIAPYVISAIVAFIILNRKKKPNQKQFNCARCEAISNFDSRTIHAWNNRFMKLYCNTCHQRWLRENSVKPTRSYSVGHGSGCLVLFCVLAIAPVLAGVAVYQ